MALAGMSRGTTSPAEGRIRRSLLVCLFGLGACKPNLPPAPANTPEACADFQWMLGTWQTQDGTTQNVERWTPDDTGLLRGESITRSEGEIVYTETLRIAPGPAGLEYRAEPQDQPPNVFPLETCGRTWARFSDPAHDWPQSIHYVRTNNTLTATVSGTDNGKDRTETWSWTLAAPQSVVSDP